MNTFIHKAKKEHYAIPQINVNGLIWIECILKVAEKTRSPIILGTTDKIIDFLGGYDFICKTIRNKIESMNITVPVIIHLDHGLTVEGCKKAVDAGYDSVMFDGSKLPIEENIELTKKVVDYAHKNNVIVEGEVGAIGGNEDGVIGNVQYAKLDDCINLAQKSHIDTLAPALGSVHGKYKGEPNLGFEEMKEIQETIDIPLVLHGASGISDEDLVKAIKLGHAKINFNTEINIAWSNELREVLTNDTSLFNPQQILNPSKKAIEQTVESIIYKCQSNGKA
ncbi:class II fructose-1,6-bisphosphate aldolase [Mammaliicoccus sciuri]|uniref:class II fructose-1,6-bisphosphate aldolase n=1 Tax=Mammaliicoccus TaxID=2803850 RepID=UPI000BD6B5BE|nr:class II fructose-1,6-bisphosphate aldolase [Mammaliicoccus sciuri]PCQ20383.1 fructose-1,6-bisphosphate aldolase, class II [Klebsiella pneumoniae]MBO3079944.1 class II fructose-1,6-bisphosphate aldolase [Mammaliicoccus sciuri]MCD8777499.1 class II fructose-1,6-bisphosphate aldolase [Mammaliicoccus sciuri]MCD8782200.1 class II fructose-1,6-bisphosphate aldolase [Mammaliicoccus sciuri]MCD8860378.1 class II fructose-1,6-bisphosphate aldolase [Mammaliicoccus sciuri]